jgi:hypothetical protein
MFDDLFRRASTVARHVTAPFAEERARHWKYCELRGDHSSAKLRKAYGLPGFFVSSVFADLQVSTDRYEQLLYLGSAICEMM